ncbi:MAG: CBS domain-containing protein [Candidatus Njordarchaeia archaeon]
MKIQDLKVKDLARDFIKVSKDEQYSEAFWKLEESKDTHLVVVENDKPIGIISIKDFTRILTDRLRRKRLSHVFASGLMTPNPITIDGEKPLIEAPKIMLEKGISSLLVKIDEENYKIITKRDFLKSVELLENKPVTQIMTNKPITAPSGTKITGAEKMMRDMNISILPIVEDGILVGFVDVRLISKYLVELFLDPKHKHPEKLLKEQTLEDVMIPPPIVTLEDTIYDVSFLLIKRGYKGTPIVTSDKNRRVIGIITETDITRLFAQI